MRPDQKNSMRPDVGSRKVGVMSTVRSVTAQFLASKKSLETRDRYKKDIVLWQRWCKENGVHALDANWKHCQAFIDFLRERYAPSSVQSRVSALTSWFDALMKAGIVHGHGWRDAWVPKPFRRLEAPYVPSEDELRAIMDAAGKAGPRWEWLVGMVAYCALEPAEALRVRGMDVRTVNGQTLLRVRGRAERARDVAVSGRLEVLSLGLAAVFAPTSPLAGGLTPDRASVRVKRFVEAAIGRPLTAQELRRASVYRQYRRGVDPLIISKWLGHTNERWVRRVLSLPSRLKTVSQDEVIAAIAVEDDGGRFGSGDETDSTVPDDLQSAS